jgi:P4 family phage/plasmid primase-like protien
MNDAQMIEAARSLRERGFALVWLRPGEKRPKRMGWTESSEEPEAYSPGSNLGLMTGRLSGDLVCVDLDSPDALAKADDFLPPTGMIDGRASKPRSHRWFRVVNIPEGLVSSAAGGIGGPWLKHFRHTESEVNLLDFLGTGGQAVVPPSIHDSKEPRIWAVDGEPATVDMATLWAAVCELAKACGWQPKPGRVAKSAALAPTDERIDRARAYVATCEPARSGHGGHDTTFRIARLLTNDFALPEADAWPLLTEFNERLDERWTDRDLSHKLTSAIEKGPDHRFGTKASPEPYDNPHRLAREFISETATWRFWQSMYYRYDGQRYIHVPEREVEALLSNHIKTRFDAAYSAQTRRWEAARIAWQNTIDQLTAENNEGQGRGRPRKPPREPMQPKLRPVLPAIINATRKALEGITLVPGTVPMPSMLPSGEERNLIALENGLLDLDTRELLDHTDEWFSPVCLPYRFDADAECPKWRDMLAMNLDGDAERIAVLQEWAGYLLTRNTDAQRCLILIGDGGTGKSSILAALKALIGGDNYSSLSLEQFGERFGPLQTLGKLANFCCDVGELDKAAESFIKPFVSGDTMSFEPKGKPVFQAVPTARLIAASNYFPAFRDRTRGMWRRICLLPVDAQIPPDKRVAGMDKPEFWTNEAPDILNWALDGLTRLRGNGWQFTESQAGKKALAEYQLDANPAKRFLMENYQPVEGAHLAWPELYQQYLQWMGNAGNRYPLGDQQFAREVERVFRAITRERKRHDGRQMTWWIGLAKLPDRIAA